MSRWRAWLAPLACAATLVAVAGFALTIFGSSGYSMVLRACAWHVTGAAFSYAAVLLLDSLTAAQRHIALATAVCVPAFGPALAWTFFLGNPPGAVNAHARFEAERRGAPSVPDSDPCPNTRVESYRQVLRSGSIERRRNLLRRLSLLGEPRHLAVLRRCLGDPETEVRLCAYAELQKRNRAHEERIATLRTEIHGADARTDPAASARLLAEVAEAQLAYAKSGGLDSEISRFWTQEAAKAASQALETDPESVRAACAEALARSALGDQDGAAACLDGITAEPTPEYLATRCEIDFACRDFDALRRRMRDLARLGGELPAWARALDVEVDPAEPEAVR